jgi:hypothetical protein
MRLISAPGALLALPLFMSACTGGNGQPQPSTPPSSQPSPRPSTSAASPPPLALRLDLDTTTARAGTEIRGILWFTNTAGKPILIDCQIRVGLANGHVPFKPAWTDEACRRAIDPGLSRIPITVLTTYTSCTPVQTPGALKCEPNGAIQALPVGRYHVVVLVPPLEKALPQPPATTVVVT